MHQWFRFLLKGIAVLLSVWVFYILMALLLSYIPINNAFRSLPHNVAGTDVYVRSNGVHTDIVLPMSPAIAEMIPQQDLRNQLGELPYVSFGWGDKGFYLETPTWADLKLSTAFIAALGLGSTVMHVQAVVQPQIGDEVRHIRLTDAQLATLLAYIRASFIYNKQHRVEKINTKAHFNEHDAFYEARGRYSLLNTCNEWTRKGLSEAGIRTVVFSPHEAGILRYLNQND